MWLRAWTMAVLVLGCGGPDGAPDGGIDGASADVPVPIADDVGRAGPDVPFCHWDCFYERRCVDGQVIEQLHRPVPCEEWTGACPSFTAGTCSEGCSDRPPADDYRPGSHPGFEWYRWCAERELRRAGDPCGTDEDCQDPESTVSERRYLACDTPSGTCASAPAPLRPLDDGEACGVDVAGVPEHAAALLDDPSCQSEACFAANEALDACDPSFCAMPCEDDWDCPADLSCREFGSLEVGTARICAANTALPCL